MPSTLSPRQTTMSRKLLCEAPGLDWTIVRPTGLTDKQPARTWRSYEVGSGAKLGGPIPRRDLAACLLNALLTLRCRGQGVWSKQLRRQIDLEPGQTGRTPRTSARRRRHPCAVTGFAGVAAVACVRALAGPLNHSTIPAKTQIPKVRAAAPPPVPLTYRAEAPEGGPEGHHRSGGGCCRGHDDPPAGGRHP